MIAKLTAFAVALVLVSATVALAAVPQEKDDPIESAISQAAPPLYVSTSALPSAFANINESHDLVLEP